jgi:uncharacterized protein
MSQDNEGGDDQTANTTPNPVPTLASTPAPIYNFQWDAVKAQTNLLKHKVSFEQACTVFKDSMLLTVYDVDHSEFEERWFSVGYDTNSILLAVSHTYQTTGPINFTVRVISARSATRDERRQYEEILR